MIIIMAGGRSRRMGREKAVLEVNGKPMLLMVHEQAKEIDETLVALSKNTPRTKELCIKEGIDFTETSGRDYISDVQWLLGEFGEFISVACDLPFIKASDIYEIKKAFKGRSLTGVLPISIIPKDLKPLIYRKYAIVGLNAVSFEGNEFFELRNFLLALNVNTPSDLRLANRIAKLIEKT